MELIVVSRCHVIQIVTTFLQIALEEEKDILGRAGSVQDLVKCRSLAVFDVSNHGVRHNKEARALESVICIEVPEADHSVLRAVHKGIDSKVLRRTFYDFGVLNGSDSWYEVDIFIQVCFFEKLGM